MTTTLTICDGCEQERVTERHDRSELCPDCVADLTTTCPDCKARLWKDEVMSTGRCFPCQTRYDEQVTEQLTEMVEMLVASGRGAKALEALYAL